MSTKTIIGTVFLLILLSIMPSATAKAARDIELFNEDNCRINVKRTESLKIPVKSTIIIKFKNAICNEIILKDVDTDEEVYSKVVDIFRDDGTVKIKNVPAGKYQITFDARCDNKADSIVILYRPKKEYKCKSLKFTKEAITIKTYRPKKLNLKVTPSYATDDLTWETSDSKVATVSKSGTVTGLKEGTVTITAKMGKYKATCTVTVKKAPGIEIPGAYFKINSAGGVEPVIFINNYTNKEIKYITVNVEFLNRVKDPAYCKIRNRYTASLKITGPISAQSTNNDYYWDPIIYNSSTGYMFIKTCEVEYMDKTKENVKINKEYTTEGYYPDEWL